MLRLLHEQQPRKVLRRARRVPPLAMPALRARLKRDPRDRAARWRLIDPYLC